MEGAVLLVAEVVVLLAVVLAGVVDGVVSKCIILIHLLHYSVFIYLNKL